MAYVPAGRFFTTTVSDEAVTSTEMPLYACSFSKNRSPLLKMPISMVPSMVLILSTVIVSEWPSVGGLLNRRQMNKRSVVIRCLVYLIWLVCDEFQYAITTEATIRLRMATFRRCLRENRNVFTGSYLFEFLTDHHMPRV